MPSYREFKTCLQLHWLPVLFRINFKILLLTFKAIRGLATSYINDLVKLYMVSGLLEYCGILLSQPNFKTSTTLGDRNFVASAPKPWNSLPFKIRMATSVDHFKKRLKTHFLARLFLGKISALWHYLFTYLFIYYL